MNIKKIADEVEKEWFGPTGKIWCKEEKQFIAPGECSKDCPDCEALRSPDIKQFRYLHLHDDFKSY